MSKPQQSSGAWWATHRTFHYCLSTTEHPFPWVLVSLLWYSADFLSLLYITKRNYKWSLTEIRLVTARYAPRCHFASRTDWSTNHLLTSSLKISCQETGLHRKRASGIPQYSCAQLAVAVAPKRIHHAGRWHECHCVVPDKRKSTFQHAEVGIQTHRVTFFEVFCSSGHENSWWASWECSKGSLLESTAFTAVNATGQLNL